ncbi:MAG: YicC family protein [Planctomycetes bacterium]|nr:YicC family protein [Planctomycetota bacterium]
MQSMTGFGRAVGGRRDVTVEVEVRSVNGRHLTLRPRLSPEWGSLEPTVESLVRARVERGTVDATVKIAPARSSPRPRIDDALLAVYAEALDALGGGDRAQLLRLPGVVTLEEPAVDRASVERALRATLGEALDAHHASCAAEGARMAKVMLRELAALERLVKAVGKRAPGAVRSQADALRRRLSALLEGRPLSADEPALAREVALLADKTDVTEELDRLGSHLVAVRETLASDGAVGRQLDFLLQEVGREVNTVGSKCSDVEITRSVVSMKACVERLREQAANVA